MLYFNGDSSVIYLVMQSRVNMYLYVYIIDADSVYEVFATLMWNYN